MRGVLFCLVAGCGFQTTGSSTNATGDATNATADAAPAEAGMPVDAAIDAAILDAAAPEGCVDSTISASKSYNPSVTTNGTLIPMAPHTELRLPAELPVVTGNAGNHCSELTFKRIDNTLVRCRYQGGSSLSSPTTAMNASEIENGKRYVFDQCRLGAACPSPNGTTVSLAANDTVELAGDLTPITLRIDNGDSAAGTTMIRYGLRNCDPD